MALTQVTEKGIKDGEIVNADVNASAAIAGSKLVAATTSAPGSMSAADKTKLDGITASANNYTHPNHSGDVTSSADGATTIANDAVTGAKIADDAVGSEHIEVLDAALQFGDNVKAQFGAGNDLQIFHSGTDSKLTNTTGDLYIQNTDTNPNQIYIRGKGGENSIVVNGDGAVELYHDNSKKFETTSDAAKITSSAHDAGLEIVAGNNNQETRIHLQGKSSGGTAHDWYLSSARSSDNFNIHDGTKTSLIAKTDGAVDLYYNNVRTFSTGTNGITLLGPEGGAAILELFADEGDDNADAWRMQAQTDGVWALENYASGGWEANIKASGNGSVDLYYDNSKKFETTSTGASFGTNHATFADDGMIRMGAGNDLNLWHDGSNSYIENKTGNLEFQAKQAETACKMIPDGSVELYYDNSKKLETISTGLNVTGGVRLGGNNAANELDDYEEGAWYPVVSNGVSSPTYNTQLGRYTKVGNLVTVWFYVYLSGGTANSDQFQITLPIAQANNSMYPVFTGYNNTSASAVVNPIMLAFPNSTQLRMYTQGGTGITATAGSTLGNGTAQLWSGTYESA